MLRTFISKIAAIAILFDAALFTSGCSSLLYHPTAFHYVESKQFNQPPDEITFETADHQKLLGWYFHSQAKNPRGVILHFHGNAENMRSHLFQMLWLTERQFDYFIFDYRGYGESEGKPSPFGTVLDGRAALDYLQKKNEKLPIVLLGQSLGVPVALETAMQASSNKNIAAIVLEGGFLSYEEAGSSVLQKSWITWLFSPLAYLLLSDSSAPTRGFSDLPKVSVLVVHGVKDGTIPYRLGSQMFADLPEPKDFWSVKDAGHLNIFNRRDPIYRDRLVSYLNQKIGLTAAADEASKKK